MPLHVVVAISIAIFLHSPLLFAKTTTFCLTKHLEDSILVNEARKAKYADMTQQKSLAVSNGLIQFEKDLLFLTKLSDVLAWPFQKWGEAVWCDDVVDMTEIPSQQIQPNAEKPDLKKFVEYSVDELQWRLYNSLFPGGLAGLEHQARRELNDLSFEPRFHCMTRHFLESIIRFVEKSEFSTRWMTFLSVLAQIHHLKTTQHLDRLSAPIQSEGVEIICRDVPALL